MWITNRCENMLSFTLIRKMKIWATVILWYIWCIWHQEHITFYSPCCIQQSYFQWQPWAEALCDVKGTKCFKIDVDADSLSLMDFFFFFGSLLSFFWRRKWQSTPVFLPGKSHGQRSLVGCSPWGRKESVTTEWLTHLGFFWSMLLYIDSPLQIFFQIQRNY